MKELRGRRTILRSVTVEDAETLRRIHLAPEVVAWWGRPDQGFPLSDDPHATSRIAATPGSTSSSHRSSAEGGSGPTYPEGTWRDVLLMEFVTGT
ncbi:MAG: hypothetical protein M3131_07080 [Actinomycetota bacterium]|nr:hypothetical protein [Actinomycetota bacterium]